MHSGEYRGLAGPAAAYYDHAQEIHRLDSMHGQLEFLRTTEIISRYMPTAPARVLDIGGGAGNYSFWLAEQGHSVHLVDAMPIHIEQAGQSPRSGRVTSLSIGDARSLDFPDESMDVVLMLGPLYHLTDSADRLQALREAHRVLVPGGSFLVRLSHGLLRL